MGPTEGTSGPILVDSQEIVCDGLLADSARCTQIARIVTTRHLYAAVPDKNGNMEHVLWQTHYIAICPACGSRRIVVSHGPKPL